MSVGSRERQQARPPRRARPARPERSRRARRAPAGPSKLAAARRVGLAPRTAFLGAGLLFAALVTAALATDNRGAGLVRFGATAAQTRLASLGFRLEDVRVQGAGDSARKDIIAAARLRRGAPLFALDLNAIRARVETVSWVERASVVRLWPDTLVIWVRQKPIVALWQSGGATQVIAADGSAVAHADPARFAGLPLVVGQGANRAAAAVLPAIAAHPALAPRMAALIRVDDRRWNLRLKNGGDVLLPAVGVAAALDRLDDLERRGRILDLGLARIDLRDPEMVVVRPRTPTAAPASPNPARSIA